MTKKLSELTRAAIMADLRSGRSNRSISRDLAVSYYHVNRLSEEISSAEFGGAEKLAPQDAPSPSRSDVADQGHLGPVDQGAATPGPVIETVIEPETGEQVGFVKVTEPIPLVQETVYLVASEPILPSRQTGTKFDELAMQENPEISELMHNPPTAAPTKYVDDGRPYIRRRVEWHGHRMPESGGAQIDGEPVTEEIGLKAARESLPGFYEDPETGKRSYVIQFHPDTPEDLLGGEPDTMEPTGKLPGGYEYEPTKGVIIRRRRNMTPEEWEQQRYERNMKLLSEHFG